MRHGAKGKVCSSEGCTNLAKRGGVCRRHGVYRNPHDESTAFTMHESAYDDTTATLPNQRTAVVASVNQEQGRNRNHPKVIICQVVTDYVEV